MLILAFDTSGFSGSVAVLDGSHVLGEAKLPAERRSAQTLAPAIVSLLQQVNVEPRRIRLVATTIGPGSFTGLRVGVTTAKTLAYAVRADAMGVSTLEAIAHSVPHELLAGPPREVHAVLDAQRRELFIGRFLSDGTAVASGLPGLTRLAADCLASADDWLTSLPLGALVTGPGLARVEKQLPAGVTVVEPSFRDAKASVVGRLAWRDYQAGRRDDLWKLSPLYLRPSYAEEKSLAGTKPGPGAS